MQNQFFVGQTGKFLVQVLSIGSNSVLESLLVQATTITSGMLNVTCLQANKFKYSNTNYLFQFTIPRALSSNNLIRIEFLEPMSWVLSSQCNLLQGFTYTQTPTCALQYQTSIYVIDNFPATDPTVNQIVQVNLRSPTTEENYNVTVETFDKARNSVIDT